MSSNTGLTYKRSARILTVACGILFSAFSFTYLFVFQRDVLEALHFSLSQGKTVYSPVVGAAIITLVLLMFRWGINGLLGLKGLVRTLSYFPSCLLLGVLTDVDRTLYHGGSILGKWMWLLPLLLLIYVGIVYTWRRISRRWFNLEGSVLWLVNSNLAILFLLCLMTVCIGNSNINFHHELAVEKAIHEKDYVAALRVGRKSLEASRTLTVLRAFALSQSGEMGERLFEFPQYYGSKGLLFDPSSQEVLRIEVENLYHYLGAKPDPSESAMEYLARICHDEVGNHTALDYYLSGLLLDKELERFAKAAEVCFFEQDTLPRYYREALVLHRQSHSDYALQVRDSLMLERFGKFTVRQKEFVSPIEEKNQMRREFGDTYWWYYYYQ